MKSISLWQIKAVSEISSAVRIIVNLLFWRLIVLARQENNVTKCLLFVLVFLNNILHKKIQVWTHFRVYHHKKKLI